ncbi:MAG: DUF2130 domain-containing protein [Bacilli bacterium]|nr:DUF2130 domain-containing protein [Bacilli bacterium]
MNEIKCPNCKTVFQIDEKDYQSIVKQIRDQEFEKEIERKEREFEKDKESSLKLVESNLKEKFKEELHQKEIELQELKNDIKVKEDNQEKELKIKESEWKEKSKEEIEKLTIEINNLKKDLDLKDKDKELAIKDTIYEKEKEVQKLKNDLVTVKETFEEKIKNKDEQIAYYKDFKARQSTKMIGESLEQHCSTEFNQIRPLFGENVYFDKDNDAKTGSKGDFIFRETDDDGIEILSIMFEMKNEADETATKHKNEDFLKELDKDRKEKNCEYAILVSLLEMDNDFYNNGIVDMSHKYPKMYVIRPQFFIPLITLLRGAALNTLKYKKQLTTIQNENLDITHFEDNLIEFKEKFGKNYRLASERFHSAIEEIDKSIAHLQKIKENLLKSEDNLRLANSKAEDLSIEKLTKNAPSVRKMFEDKA